MRAGGRAGFTVREASRLNPKKVMASASAKEVEVTTGADGKSVLIVVPLPTGLRNLSRDLDEPLGEQCRVLPLHHTNEILIIVIYFVIIIL